MWCPLYVYPLYVLNPVLSGGGNDESSSVSQEGEEKETPDDETQDNNPKIAKLTGMSKFMLFTLINYRGIQGSTHHLFREPGPRTVQIWCVDP